jgi:large subunit ribosomal protein L22
MKVKATVKYLRVSAKKARLILPLIKGKKALDAVSTLENYKSKSSRFTLGVLNSAIANARVKKMVVENCVISDARTHVGPTFKRLMTRSMGRADRILKRTSHITVELTEQAPAKPEQEKATTSSRR